MRSLFLVWIFFFFGCGVGTGVNTVHGVSVSSVGEDGGTEDGGADAGASLHPMGVVYVDGVVGDNSNLGTMQSPVATIAKGIEIAGRIQYARHLVTVRVAHSKHSASIDYNESIIIENNNLVRIEIIADGGIAGGIGATGFGLTTVLGFRSAADNGNLRYVKLRGFKFTSDVVFDADSTETQFVVEGAQIANSQIGGELSLSRLSRFRVDDSIIYGDTTAVNVRVFELFGTRAQDLAGAFSSVKITVDGNKTYPDHFTVSVFRAHNSRIGGVTAETINGSAYKPQVEIKENSHVSGVLDLDSDLITYDGTITWGASGSCLAAGNTYYYNGGIVNPGSDFVISGSVSHYSQFAPEWWGTEPDTGACTTTGGLRGHCTQSMDSTGDCGCSL